MIEMMWHRSNRYDPDALPLADRHYNRRKVGSPQFVPPGRCLVLLNRGASALWVTSYPFAEYVRHDWPGALVCSLFRRERDCPDLASDMIRAACAATAAEWPVPIEGMVTFLDKTQVRPTMVRGREVYGWTWMKAGFHPVGETRGGLLAFALPPFSFPDSVDPLPSLPPSGQLTLHDMEVPA